MENQIYQEAITINGNRFSVAILKEDADAQPEFVVDVLGLPDYDIVKTFYTMQDALDWMNKFGLIDLVSEYLTSIGFNNVTEKDAQFYINYAQRVDIDSMEVLDPEEILQIREIVRNFSFECQK